MIDFELNRKQRQSPVYKAIFIFGGLLFLGLGLIKIFLREDFVFDSVFWIDVIHVLLGIIWALHGLNILNLGIKGVVKIDDNRLFFNAPSFQKYTQISWSNIEKVEIKITKLMITDVHKNVIKIELGWIPYNDLIAIKSEVEHVAEKKNITVQK